MEENRKPFNKESENTKPSPVWVSAAAAFGGGAVAGFGGALLLGGVPAAAAEVNDGQTEGEGEEIIEPIDNNTSTWTDGKVPVAHGVNDGMSFGQAFAAARAEVGPGGVFEWRGGVYGTFNAKEWESMSPAERSEWSSHFNWSNVTTEPEQRGGHGGGTHHTPDDNHDDGNDHPKQEEPDNGGGSKNNEPEKPEQPKQPEKPVEPEHKYEIYSVQETEDGTITAYGKMDGHDCVFIDRDADGKFDVIAVDLNDDGELQEGEVQAVDGEILTVDWAINQIEKPEPVRPDQHHSPEDYEVISVQTDDEATSAIVEADGKLYLLIDSDGDGVFDVRFTDVNGDGQVQEEELEYISPSEGLTVEWAMSKARNTEVVEPADEDEDDIIVVDDDEEETEEEEEIIYVDDDEEITPDDPVDDTTTFDDI